MKIALTHTGNPEKHSYYISWLKGGEDIEIVEMSASLDNLHALENCNGLLLSGGIDVHPQFYGGDKDYPGKPDQFNEPRDRFEIAAYNWARENQLPILAVCRGMQLVNVIHNGTLIQHLPNDHLIAKHKGEPDKQHEVHVEPGSLLHDIIRSKTTKINSAHHQSIEKLGEDLVINAKSEEGIIEGIEWKKKSTFFLGIQWHPERMFRFSLNETPASKGIRNRFVSEIKKHL